MERTAALHTTLVGPDTLAGHLDDPGWAIVDCRFDLGAPDAGERLYTESHVPGAVYAHLDRDLSGRPTGTNGRHPLPEPAAIEAMLGRLGIGPGVQAIVYDQDAGLYAARLWWMLRYVGHDAVALLDGGYARWTAEGRPTRAGRETRPARRFVARPRPERLATAADIVERLADPGVRLIDARAPERFRGDTEPLDRIAGHIPGAVNHFCRTNVSPGGVFLDSDELRRRYTATLAGVAPENSIVYCGSGVTACHDLLAMEHAGLRGGRLYVGSWSEWSADQARPVERS